ncbi:MAG: class I SAM-dependent methyltransferase [Ghiorsea sp.]|nr:class I SAM-dependent methyltransferase [Ghiorsea sp.]
MVLAPYVAKVSAVDISPSMLAKLTEKLELQDKVDTFCQGILEQPLNQKFDVIISAMAMHHVEDTYKMIQAFAVHVKEGGQVALADLDKEDGSFHPTDIEGVYHDGFDQDMLKQKFVDAGNKGMKDLCSVRFFGCISITPPSILIFSSKLRFGAYLCLDSLK